MFVWNIKLNGKKLVKIFLVIIALATIIPGGIILALTLYIISNIAPQEDSKIIDPSCGSGAFLLGIIKYYQRNFNKSTEKIIKENLYGIDILEYNTRRSNTE